ncbi:aminotransferase class I/II-fold pyridoxal phosphate-dependent enzyme [Paenibacillus barengoltzii]|uniref:aminotransferase class I/II-fold pyridoxal phosphate-dependent enzyme n=1 Tax=Paenibacillus barengoltzii TaxID=343517 RepID=UPI00055BCB5E|nr:aminotransferase class I/II-fold pyridoxal phosphate-dependent enzyme [Paenibacillus barengoltzii]
MDTGLEMLKRRLPPVFAQEIEDGVRGGRLISLAGLHGNGGGVRLEGISAADDQGQSGSKEGRRDAGALLEWLAEAYEEAEGIRTDPQQWLLAESADGALDLLLRVLVPGGGTVLVETPAAPEALELMRRRGIRAVPVACDRDGMLPDDLRRKCEPSGGRPAFIYVTPHFANPSGRVWSRQRKLALLELSERLGVPIVEDDTACLVPLAEGVFATGRGKRMKVSAAKASTKPEEGIHKDGEAKRDAGSHPISGAAETKDGVGKRRETENKPEADNLRGAGYQENRVEPAAEDTGMNSSESPGKGGAKSSGLRGELGVGPRVEVRGEPDVDLKSELLAEQSGVNEGVAEGKSLAVRQVEREAEGHRRVENLGEAGAGADTTSLYALRQQAGLWGAEIVSLGSLERTLTPQLPLAWLRGEAKTMERLRQVPSPGSSSAAGAAVAERARRLHAWLAQPPGRGRAAAAAAAAAYAARRALALELLQAPAWRGACVEDPGGGLFLWLRLPAGVSSEALLRASLLEGTAFLPGTLCYAKEPDDRFIRLTVAAHDPAQLREGLARLTAALAEFTVRSVD